MVKKRLLLAKRLLKPDGVLIVTIDENEVHHFGVLLEQIFDNYRSAGVGGIIANIGVHGVKVDLHLEKLWDRNIAITTRLVDTVTTPMLLKTVQSRKIDPRRLITHRFKLDQIADAYETFGHAANTNALKVIIAT